MVGTPVVWPQGTGVVAQKFFIGDADGTIWKFDISSPNMANWKGGMFYDMYNTEVVDADFGKTFTAAELAEASQPVEVAPLLSLDQNGNLVIHAATGDLENFASKKFLAADLDDADPDDRDDEANKVPIYNYLIAIREIPQVDQSGARVYRAYNYNAAGSYTAFNTWRHAMTNGERVSGPMVVFDRTIYYATWAPAANLICGANGGESRIYGRDYLAIPSVAPIPAPCSAGQAHCGGQVKLASAYITAQSIDPLAAGKLVPGLALQASPACADTQTQTDYYTGNSYTSMTSYTPSKYSIFASVGTAAPSGPGPLTINVNVPQPNTTVRLSSWAAVID
jgi:type IV pilus assembly protein PilY1